MSVVKDRPTDQRNGANINKYADYRLLAAITTWSERAVDRASAVQRAAAISLCRVPPGPPTTPYAVNLECANPYAPLEQLATYKHLQSNGEDPKRHGDKEQSENTVEQLGLLRGEIQILRDYIDTLAEVLNKKLDKFSSLLLKISLAT
ncbi:hypothetical protein NDU88_000947 [Pleurodeles waltl]|uniref:Uncharacterized protein n=1 Tax=Pleurodeles waltl TaxID=8319 RepID=A0AAV7TG87_PLEWA|nr:hypothetical protein NDU88_000947 [Pleurodeles waltl]